MLGRSGVGFGSLSCAMCSCTEPAGRRSCSLPSFWRCAICRTTGMMTAASMKKYSAAARFRISFFLCAFIAVTEEWLFRGIVQTHWGLWAASAIFAVLHVRYLEKWFLFMVVVLLSLFLGVLYEQTDSLWAAITAHFLIDFVLALHVRLKRGAEEERE
ncbi:CAAX amino terminal protease family protein [Geobacillus sp. WSUCF1]|nr:CAAX amino terminal protease family protein [Geobacillus sp. WSUCF1]